MSDGVLAIVAGSDTTSSVLSGLFHYLLAHPASYRRLQEELDDAFPPGEGDPFDANELAELPFLNAVMCATVPVSLSMFTHSSNLTLAMRLCVCNLRYRRVSSVLQK